jgi:hypothetical protein
MEKKGLGTIYDVAVDNISIDKTRNGQKIPDFMFHQETDFLKKGKIINNPMVIPFNQTWSIPDRSYTWFPYFMMYLTEE